MLLLETDLARFDNTTPEQMIHDLPTSWQARITRKKPFRARLQSAIGYTLLRRILQDNFGVTVLPEIETGENGKPIFKDCPLFFSISHCCAAVVCIVETYPVAVDVQDRLFDPDGHMKLRIGAPLDLDDHTLTALWTQKEASAKLDGRGISIGLDRLPLKHHHLQTTEYRDFTITVATENAEVSC